ncbi:hypothetical protein Tco_0944199 [Tanacetum coccineum]
MDTLEQQLTKETILESNCQNAFRVLKTQFEKILSSVLIKPSSLDGMYARKDFHAYTSMEPQLFKEIILKNFDFIEDYMLKTIIHAQTIQKRLDDKKLQIQECTVQEVKALDAISEDKAKKSCMVSFRKLHSHLKHLSHDNLKGTRIESGFKRAFATLFGQDVETFIGTMFLNVDQLEKQLDKEEFQEIGSIASFKVLETQFQMFIKSRMYLDDEFVVMTRNYFLQYTQLAIPEFRDTLIQHMESVKKSIDERAKHKEEYNMGLWDSIERAREKQRQQHTEQPEFNNEGEVDQNVEQCHDTCPLPAKITDNQTTKHSYQSLESENICLRWVPTGKIFTSSTTKVDSEPTNGSNEDITNLYEYEQTLDVNARYFNLIAVKNSEFTTSTMLHSSSRAGSKSCSSMQTASYITTRVGITIPPSHNNAEYMINKCIRAVWKLCIEELNCRLAEQDILHPYHIKRRVHQLVKTLLLLLLRTANTYGLLRNLENANSLWAAIKARFGGNEESKKMQKMVFEVDEKVSSSLLLLKNVAFLSLRQSCSTNEVSTAVEILGLVLLEEEQCTKQRSSSQALDGSDWSRCYDGSNVFEVETRYNWFWIWLTFDQLSNYSKTHSEIILSVFDVISSDEENTPANDRFSKADGFHDVPPPITGNFLTPRADISFTGLDEYAIRKKIIESKTTDLNTKTSETVGKTNEANTQKPKTVYESVKLLHDTIAAQRRFLAQQRAAEIRSRPPTRTQLRNQMMTYLKHVGGKKHSDLKNKNFEEIQVLYEKVKSSDENFVAIGSAEDERIIRGLNKKVVGTKKADSIKEESKEEAGTRKRKLGTRKKMKSRKEDSDMIEVGNLEDSTMALELIRFVKKLIAELEPEDSNGNEEDL